MIFVLWLIDYGVGREEVWREKLKKKDALLSEWNHDDTIYYSVYYPSSGGKFDTYVHFKREKPQSSLRYSGSG